jgi:hypothetical protein
MNMDEMKMMMDEDKERWSAIEGYEGYEISTKGRVRSYWKKKYNDKNPKHIIITFKILSINISTSTGYKYVMLTNEIHSRPENIHRLLAKTFIPNPHNYPWVDHVDRNRTNNSLTNLRWISHHGNNINIERQQQNSSGFRGVGIANDREKKYYAHGKTRDGQKYKKYFYNLEEAIEYRNKMVEENYDKNFYTS